MMFAEYFKSEINSLHSFLLEQFHKNKKLDFGNNNNNNKIKNMLRTKPGPSTEPTEHKNRSGRKQGVEKGCIGNERVN